MLLARPQLFDLLDSFASRPLTLLSAPCGYGKTSLLATWRARARGPVAWLTVESSESEAPTFLAHVADAIERACPGTGTRAGTRLRTREVTPDLALRELLEDLVSAASLALVLDDLDAIEDPESFALLSYMAEHLPAGVRILVATRADPPLPLGRLRAGGLLGEIRARDLAFTLSETRDVVAQAGLVLDDRHVRLIADRTENWPAAVYLTALWLRDRRDLPGGLDAYGGRKFIGEYLMDEVLQSLPSRTRTFLVRTSALSYLSPQLCDAVLQRRDSARFLHEIVRSNLLITKLERDGDWFQVHSLFREVLRLELGREDPSVVRGLHTRASRWLAEHDFLVGAVAHATAAGDHEFAAQLISGSAQPLIAQGESELLLRLVEQLPVDVLLLDPELTAGAALAATFDGRPRYERQRWLDIGTRARQRSPEAWSARAAIVTSLAQAVAVDGDVGAAATHARRVIRLALKDGLPEYETPGQSTLAYAQYLSGSLADASTHAADAVASARAMERPSAIVRALGVLALVAVDSGRSEEAANVTSRALDIARDHGLSAARSLHATHLARARVLLGRGELREAVAAAKLGERLSRVPDPSAPHAFALLVLAETEVGYGRLEAAESTLERAKSEIAGLPDPGRIPRTFDAVRRSLRTALRSPTTNIEPLSPAELEVLRLLPGELSQRAIGRELFISVNTVKTHTRSIYRKLGVGSRPTAVVKAGALGLIP